MISIIAFLLGFTLFTAHSIVAQENCCDPDLKAPTNHPFGYVSRGDRCEGIYIQEVSSTTLSVVSFTEYFEDYDLSSDKDLLVEWKVSVNNDIKLRAQGIKSRLYYRMDTVLPGNSTTYNWPTNILAAMDIHKNDIGIVGWSRLPVGEKQQEVFIPLCISQQLKKVHSASYRLVIVPGRELKEVFISLANVDSEGNQASFLKTDEPLKFGFYPAGRSIAIPIPSSYARGIYYLEIGATLRSGGTATIEMFFYHRGSIGHNENK